MEKFVERLDQGSITKAVAVGRFQTGGDSGDRVVPNDDIAELIDSCLAENQRRMSAYDSRLLRPFAVPALAKLARRFMRSSSKTQTRA